MPTEIDPGVYDLTCRLDESGQRFRAFLFDGEVPTLVDAGFADTTDALFAEIEAVGVEPERLVITHGDNDHVGGFDAVVERYGVETWLPAGTRERIRTFRPSVEPETPEDHVYGDGDDVGRFVAVHQPGHTPDNHALVDESAGLLVLGDVLFESSLRGLPAGYFTLPPAIYSGDIHEAETHLARLLEYEFDRAVAFHGASLVEDARSKLEAYLEFPGSEGYVDRWGVDEENAAAHAPGFLAALAERDPDVGEPLATLYARVGRDGALSAREKALIVTAIDAAMDRPAGVRANADRAERYGASEDEVLEAIEVATVTKALQGLATGWQGIGDDGGS